MEKTYNDPVKQIARERLRAFCEKYLQKDPRPMEVFCFPGAEKEGQEGLELAIYDAMGIPRHNITGVELDRTRFERLERAGLGIKLFYGTEIEAFWEAERKKQKWDIISLDYTSFFTDQRMYALERIASGRLAHKGVLATNYLAKREHAQAKHMLREHYAVGKVEMVQHMSEDHETASRRIDRRKSSFDLGEHRGQALRRFIMDIFIYGRLASDDTLYRRMIDLEGMVGWLYEKYPWLKDEVAELTGRTEQERLMRTGPFRLNAQSNLHAALMAAGLPSFLGNFVFWQYAQSSFVEATESYRYISNSGTPMLSDFFYFDKHMQEINELAGVVTLQGLGKVLIDPQKRNPEKIRKRLARVKRLSDELWQRWKFLDYDTTPRVYLGSSYVVPPRKERISKEQALDLLESGFTAKEIAEVYDGFTKMQLAAFITHMRHGKYARSGSESTT